MEQSLKHWSCTGISFPFIKMRVVCNWIYCISVEREGVEGASESLIFSFLIIVLSNPPSDCAALGKLFFAELFIFISEGAGAESQSSLPWSLTLLCWKQEPGYCLRVAVALLSQPGTVNFAQTHRGGERWQSALVNKFQIQFLWNKNPFLIQAHFVLFDHMMGCLRKDSCAKPFCKVFLCRPFH